MQLSNNSIPTHRMSSFHLHLVRRHTDLPTPHHPFPHLLAHLEFALHKPSPLQVLENRVSTIIKPTHPPRAQPRSPPLRLETTFHLALHLAARQVDSARTVFCQRLHRDMLRNLMCSQACHARAKRRCATTRELPTRRLCWAGQVTRCTCWFKQTGGCESVQAAGSDERLRWRCGWVLGWVLGLLLACLLACLLFLNRSCTKDYCKQ